MKNVKESKYSEDTNLKEFWDSLQADILVSKQSYTREDIRAIIERSFMFSIFFRGCTQAELINYRNILHLKDNGYIVLIKLSSPGKTFKSELSIDELSLHHFIKRYLSGINNAIGPLIDNRITIMITNNSFSDQVRNESIPLIKGLICRIHKELQIVSFAAIGNVYSTSSVYSSFLDALSCMQYCRPNHVCHIQELEIDKEKQELYFDYYEAEKHMLEAIRLRKSEAYDYFCILMNQICNFNEEAKINKILEILVLISHSLRMDDPKKAHYFSYVENFDKLSKMKGEQLTNWAFQKFLYITGNEKPQNSIDYSNKIVQATKEYLEAHYAEEITLDDVAQQVNISPQYFSKLIKKNTGFNFIDWLSMLRVKKAKELLTNSNLTVKEVCYQVGYKDPNYFSRIFKKRIGITPSEFVKNVSRSNM